MALSQNQIAAQMVAQLRLLDPSISAEIGTPERKIIDTVAQQIAQSQVDINVLSGSQDLAAKYGTDLDTYVGLFGFGRQSGSYSIGFATFSRSSPSSYNITIPRGTQIQGTVTTTSTTSANGSAVTVTFQTSSAVNLAAGATEVIAPLQALIAGAQSNVAANVLTQFANLGSPPLGITSVTNAVPTTGGSDAESDAELKVRFRNTVFRNLAGTEDQFLALAVSTQFSTKANVLGPISRYKEYIQVPLVDDAQPEAPTATIDCVATNNSPALIGVSVVSGGVPLVGNTITGTGIPANTTLLDIEDTTYTLSNAYTGSTGAVTGLIVLTGEPSDASGGGLPNQWTTTPSNNPYAKYIYLDVPYFISNGDVGVGTVFYRQDTDFTLNAPPLNAGDTYREFTESPQDLPDPATTPNNPNVTFFNVYTGGVNTVTLPTPGAVLLLEYSYMSAESRNDIIRNITNCVDVYINGQNPTVTDAVLPLPNSLDPFSGNAIDKFYYQNFRRMGQPDIMPTPGNIFQGLFWQPVIALPSQIVVGAATYFLGTHYWPVEDITLLGNTVRSRNGIEWVMSPSAPNGMASGDPALGPYTGPPITAAAVSSMTVTGYTYDQNVISLQAALEGVKQVTTDVLAHAATERYFKLDLTVVYSPGASAAGTNVAIQTAIQTFFDGQYFGSTIQLSDLLLVVRNTTGVQNVRWTNDVVNPTDDAINTLNRVTECDIDGNPRQAVLAATATNGSDQLTGVVVSSGTPKVFQAIVGPGLPVGAFISAINGTIYTLSENYSGVGGSLAYTVPIIFNTDFYLLDSELPTLPIGQLSTDTRPGLIIRARAQGTFNIV